MAPNEPAALSLDRVEDLPAIERALNRAVRQALMRHKKLGNPVAVWRNERVEWVQPEDIPTWEDGQDGDGDGVEPGPR